MGEANGEIQYSIWAMTQPTTQNATRFKAELWTATSGREVWATVMLDGPDKDWPCAFGPKDKMESYAQRLNDSKGEMG